MHGPCHAIYSDDGGQTWAKARGAMSNGGECHMWKSIEFKKKQNYIIML